MKRYILLTGLFIMNLQAVKPRVKSPTPNIDDQNMFNAIYTFSEQMEKAIRISKRIKLRHTYEHIDHIIFAGMGGSGMAGHMAKTLVQKQSPIAITVHNDYDLPNWVNENTLVICLSYSGNTEETLSCFDAAQEKNASIIGITTGGTLQEKLRKNRLDFVQIPNGMQPRAGLGYLTVPLLYILKKIGIIETDIEKDLQETVKLLKMSREFFSVQDQSNPTYAYAQLFKKCTPIIYGEANSTGCIAQRWKAQFAENSKMLASTHVLPELDHNEIVAWQENPDLLKRSVIIWLNDKNMHPRNRARQKITKDVIGNMPYMQLELEGIGNSWCERLFYLVHLGDWISYWCALAHNVNPTTIVNIDTLKNKMKDA
ncbi:MAG: bifunctional phosphoglucose/phosphomannose isomerase [Candidatus Dependentiae bacterium]